MDIRNKNVILLSLQESRKGNLCHFVQCTKTFMEIIEARGIPTGIRYIYVCMHIIYEYINLHTLVYLYIYITHLPRVYL